MKVLLMSSWKSTENGHPPLGIGYIASVLRENNILVEIIDYNILINDVDLAYKIRKADPDIVGISVMSMSFKNAQKIAEVAKDSLKNVKIVIGGPHATIMPIDCLRDKNIDIVVMGEGEYTFLDLVKAVDTQKSLSNVKGIYYKTKSGTKRTKLREFIENLDELSFPARDLLPMKYYLSQVPSFPIYGPETNLMAVRGCPFNCSYCQPTARDMFGQKIRYRSPENVVEEMELLLKRYRLKSLWIGGDTATANRKWTFQLCKEIRERRIKIPLILGTRVDTVDKPLLSALKKAGVYFIAFGVESGSQRILDEIMHKQITLTQVKKAFRWCNEVGILSMANLMTGSPTETRSDAKMTYDLLREINPDVTALYITNPLPGTHLYSYALENNLLRTTDFSEIGRHTEGTIKRAMTDQEVRDSIKSLEKAATRAEFISLGRTHFLKTAIKRELLIFKMNPKKSLKNFIKYPKFFTSRL